MPRWIEDRIRPPHPGEVIAELYMQPLGMTAEALAARMAVPVAQVAALLGEQADVTSDLAVGLARAFDTSAGLWLGLQRNFDADDARVARDRIADIDAGRAETLGFDEAAEELRSI